MSKPVASPPRRSRWPEILRILILVSAAVGAMSGFLTPLRVGGVDALWYADMVRGFTDQIAAGHFPVPVGEGAFAYNGGVHPFRSAPVYPAVAALWYVLTLGRLGPFALQHLTAMTSAVAGTLGFYLAACALIPARKWAAAGFSLLYLFTPSWLAAVYGAEAYMSYMAFAAMPLVLYGNARSALEPDGRGYVALGAGLALIWMCHPPIAFIASVTTLFIQTGTAITRGAVAWRGMALCVATFAVLGAYYFISMAELPSAGDGTSMASGLPRIGALALFFVGLGRCVLSPRNPAWAACAVLGAVVIGLTSTPWLIWISFSAAYWLGAVGVAYLAGRLDLGRHAFSALFIFALLGAASAEAVLGPNHPGLFRAALHTLAANTANIPSLLQPLPRPFQGDALFQPGWGLDLALAAATLSLFGRRPTGTKFLFAASLGLAICYVRAPLVSNFLDGYFPTELAAMCGIPLALRITPVIASFAAMSGVVWFATLPQSGWRMSLAATVLALAVGWSAFQAHRFVEAGHALTSPPKASADSMRPENMALSRYAYDLEHLPDYYSNGVTDPLIESRLVDASGRIRFGPMEAERVLEDRGTTRVRLLCKLLPGSIWFNVEPKITVEPGERLLLRFEFDPDRSYNGYMIMTSEHGYREYHLPDSGQSRAFGIGGDRTSVLSLWNSGDQPEHYAIAVSREPGNTLDADGGLFATLSISRFAPQLLPMRLDSLIPYRASVSSGTGGWLETFMVFIPGYRAWVDGKPAAVGRSAEALAEVPVPPGNHVVTVRFVGTPRLWSAACVSALGWLALVGLWLRKTSLRHTAPAC